jgi:hypothetical protein
MPYGIHLQSNLIEEIFQENSEKELHNTGYIYICLAEYIYSQICLKLSSNRTLNFEKELYKTGGC